MCPKIKGQEPDWIIFGESHLSLYSDNLFY